MRTSPKGIALIKSFEGFRSAAYQDVAGVWTIGYGFTKGVQARDRMTREQADARLAEELRDYEQAVEAAAGACNQNQHDALVCFAWNVGMAGMKKSSVIKAHRRGDFQAAARAFGLWDKAGGKVWPGLTRRRAAEAALYLEPVADDVSDPVEGPTQEMPQRVDAESSLVRSPIVTSTTIATGTATVGVVAEAARGVKEIRESLGDWLPWVLVAVAIGACGYTVWSRVQQRRGGWA